MNLNDYLKKCVIKFEELNMSKKDQVIVLDFIKTFWSNDVYEMKMGECYEKIHTYQHNILDENDKGIIKTTETRFFKLEIAFIINNKLKDFNIVIDQEGGFHINNNFIKLNNILGCDESIVKKEYNISLYNAYDEPFKFSCDFVWGVDSVQTEKKADEQKDFDESTEYYQLHKLYKTIVDKK